MTQEQKDAIVWDFQEAIRSIVDNDLRDGLGMIAAGLKKLTQVIETESISKQ